MKRELNKTEKGIIYFILISTGIIISIPFMQMISISLASSSTNAKGVFTIIPREFEFENYVRVFSGNIKIGKYILNSLKLVILCIIGQVTSSSIVAYGFARLRARFKNILFFMVLSTLMIPTSVYLIPQYLFFNKLGWIDTYLPLIVPNFLGHAFNIFIIRQFFMGLPTSIDESGKIDGLSYFGIFYRLLLPMIKPLLIAIGLFTFQSTWGWFFHPLIYIQTKDKFPLAVALQMLQATSGNAIPNWHYIMVGAIILSAPALFVYYFGQKYILEANIIAGSATLK